MKTGIGIDTGGTYTDAVIYDFENQRVLSSAKALTTKSDLSVGIINALDALNPALRAQAEVVALSTTLATNACVENKGGRAKLIFIGIDSETMERVGAEYGFTDMDCMRYCPGSGSFDGKVLPNVDWDTLLSSSADWLSDADGLGIVELYSMNNGAVAERKGKELFSRRFGLPVVCGSELFSGLNILQRGAGTLLNARLVPVIREFLSAIGKAMTERNISAPVVIVRSDGSLMSEEFSRSRPVETVLCGPAASVLGGMKLSGRNESMIIDMGGTTTDISLVKHGEPVRARDGVSVGNWKTFVRGVFIDTFGLGGDSAVRPAKNGFTIETRRVEPISLMAKRFPFIKDELRRLLSDTKWHTRPVYEYYYLVRSIEGRPGYTAEERNFCRALSEKPLMLREAAEKGGTDIYHLDKFERLESEGAVMRSGLTPTDFMHILGDFDSYDREAAMLAVSFLMRSLGYDDNDEEEVRKFSLSVYEAVKRKLYKNIVRVLLENKYSFLRSEGLDSQIDRIIDRSWDEFRSSGSGYFGVGFKTVAALVGIGAPTHIFLPDVAKALGTECVIPENAGVANAVGAVVGNISAEVKIEVRPNHTPGGVDGYFVCAPGEMVKINERPDAVAKALDMARALASGEARKRGIAGSLTIRTNVRDNTGHAMRSHVDFGSTVTAVAIGGAML